MGKLGYKSVDGEMKGNNPQQKIVELEQQLEEQKAVNEALKTSDLDNKEAIASLIELVLSGGVTNG
ncbi:hypothetical protein Q5741_18610 [Paenibacillus sp. JX-17]|uniref:Uncharacterized protein n=1 Tax=Paenibacillus lacisoli TaxID=3064525 RepID=A0ABT9CGT6_9BACL|nr:hypothetical protein [Paenibacillus sp. JX-17]MDO7908416.1 hypothetical protein [Paenibacillus sp. JX-17]